MEVSCSCVGGEQDNLHTRVKWFIHAYISVYDLFLCGFRIYNLIKLYVIYEQQKNKIRIMDCEKIINNKIITEEQ